MYLNSQYPWMNSGQLVLDSFYASILPSFDVWTQSVWSNSIIFPAYFTIISILAILLHFLYNSRLVRIARKALFGFKNVDQIHHATQDASSYVDDGLLPGIRQHVISLGGVYVFFFRVARFLSCLALLALATASLVFEQQKNVPSHLSPYEDSSGEKNNLFPRFPRAEWLQVTICLTYAYASMIAMIAVCARKSLANLANSHLVWVLLGTWGVYAYRDLYPLGTFTLSPMDINEGWLMWAKVGVLSFAAVVIPAIIPSQYVPFDPKNPAPEPNPEQTTSLLSFILFTFLDSIVFKAFRVSHLPAAELPPLADYDFAKNLVEQSFPHLDPMSVTAKRNLFFGLMRVFRKEYLTLASLLTIRPFFWLLSPIAINRLLTYIENNGEGSFIRPWVWITCLFLAPFIGSVCYQWYIFLTTRTLVRVQCIITQLVFEHSTRIRMKAETPDVSQSEASTAAPSPDTVSLADQTDSSVTRDNDGDDAAASSTAASASITVDTASVTGKSKKHPRSLLGKQAPSAKIEENSSDLVGKINNLVSTDLSNIVDGRDFLLLVVGAPLQIGLCIWFLYGVLGWSAIVGLIVMILLFPVPGYFASLMQKVQVNKMKMTDARVQSVTETMNVIRMIKLFGWEEKTNNRIAEKRDEELKYQKKRQLIELGNDTLNFLIPVITMVVSFACYTLVMKQDLPASRVFSAMSVFDVLREQIYMVFGLIPAIVQGKVSLDRVGEFLYNTELLDSFSESKDSVIADNVEANKNFIGFRNATFTWSNELQTPTTSGFSRRTFTLRIDDELIFKNDKINLIVGPTGSGKTSLLMALLGELHFIPIGPDSWFNLPRGGGVAYAAQESWVQNETIRENILFGAPFDEDRYNKVIDQCGLARDLTLFDAGDQTEVGEKGLSLSGGQKARVTLARAVYSSAQILILDDVLAALDVHTARWIVDKCFKGDLVRGRTVLLVTHNVAMVGPVVDFVVSIGSDGQVIGHGSLSSALEFNKDLPIDVDANKKEVNLAQEVTDAETPGKNIKQGSGKLIVAEEIAEGHVSWAALKLFFVAMGGSHAAVFWFLVVTGLTITSLSIVMQTWYLGYWAAQYDNSSNEPVNVFFYLSVFTLLIVIGATFFTLSAWTFVYGSIRASRSIHKQLIRSVLGTTLRWLDSTPVSRVIARCTQDMQSVDGPMSRYLLSLLDITLRMLFKFGAVVLLSPIFLIPGIGVAILGAWCGQVYIQAQLCVKREMSNARSPVLAHFGAAIAGIVSIRAYHAEEAFRKEALVRSDRFTRSARTFYNLNRWVSIRIDILGALFSTALAAYMVYRPRDGHQEGYAAETGFSINMAVGFSGMILWWVRILNEFEVSGNSLERVQDYISIEQEAKPTEAGVPPAYWPASGDIRVENLSAKYSKDGPEVLHNLTFHISSGERVGVVGRTGSGKSTLTLALLRCIITEGTVYFDNLPIDKINLDALRSNITIIPQIPELLSGSIRANLDPFDQHDDSTLNEALRAAGLFSIQNPNEEARITLDTPVSGGGSNFSVGQRQIFALARAIVRKSKLLVLDEATSAIDYETDSVIQSSLRHELGGDVTLITIAHRLQTIMDVDKILVLDAGNIVEFGKPSDLLQIKKGILRSLVDGSGDNENLYAMAQSRA